jgi:hypothetical protein
LRNGRSGLNVTQLSIIGILGLFVKRIGACGGVFGAHSTTGHVGLKAIQSGSIILGLSGGGLSRRL